MLKYVPPSFSQQLLDKWNRWNQGNKSATDYIAKFDEYLNRCGAIELESPVQTLSRFRFDLRDDYRRELIARGITTLEQAYQLVTDLDESRSYFNRTDLSDTFKTITTGKPSFSRTLPTPSKPASSSSSVKLAGPSGAKPIISERRAVSELGKVNPRTQCYRCQACGHLASQCPSQIKTLFVEIPIEDIERKDDGEVVVHQQDDDSMSLSKSMNSIGASKLWKWRACLLV